MFSKDFPVHEEMFFFQVVPLLLVPRLTALRMVLCVSPPFFRPLFFFGLDGGSIAMVGVLLFPQFWVAGRMLLMRPDFSCDKEVLAVWEVCDKRLKDVHGEDVSRLNDALGESHVHEAWRVWTVAAEVALVEHSH